MEPLSSDKDQERRIYTVNELAIRLFQMEELIKEQSSRAQVTDTTVATVSTGLTELSNKVAQTLAKSSLVDEPLSYGQGNFLQSYLRDMMTSLSLPGMKYIGEKGRPSLHSYLWIFIHIVAFLISYVYIKEEYINWKASPVVKTISNNLTYVNEIPFPAITVCLPGSVKDDYDYAGSIQECISCNFTEVSDCDFNEKCTYKEKASLAIASLICPYQDFELTAPWELFNQNVNDSIEGREFSMYSKNVFPQCNVKMEQTRTMNGFSLYQYKFWNMFGCDGNNYLKFVSSFGMCFTMNGLGEKDIFKENTVISSEEMSEHDKFFNVSWKGIYRGKDFTLENMLYLNGDFDTIPAYIFENHQIAFSILGRHNEESTALCSLKGTNPKDAFLAIHNPVDVPFVFNSDFDLKFGETKEIRVMPEMLITEKSLESYNPVDRGCFYSYERELAMFKRYSQNNCKTECAANCSLHNCGCVPYYLPRHNSSARVCLTDCYEDLVCDLKACSCLPDCYSLSYNFEIAKESGSEGQEGSVKMSYKTGGFYATVRVGLTNLAQFVAYCLGIVGLFNGFTVMMIFEIFYFFTFRIWDSIKSYK